MNSHTLQRVLKKRPVFLLAIAALWYCLLAFSPAMAASHVYCVKSNQDLDNALASARFADAPQGRGSEIRIARDSVNYTVDGLINVSFSNSLKLLGGYDENDGCADFGRKIDPQATRVIFISDITEAYGLNIKAQAFAADGLTIEADVQHKSILITTDGDIQITRSIWKAGNTTLLFSFPDSDTSSRAITLANNLVIGAVPFTGFTKALILDGAHNPQKRVDITNNTIISGGRGIEISDFTALSTIANNIIDVPQNFSAIIDIETQNGSPVSVRNNSTKGAIILGPSATVLNTSTADPQFADAANGDYRLQPDPKSPSVNSGDNAVFAASMASDLVGNQRTIGRPVDRGAYESAVDDRPVIVVNSLADDPTPCPANKLSLRCAIDAANLAAGGPVQAIVFADSLGCKNSGPYSIVLNSPLPAITDPLVIDGTTQQGYVPNTADQGMNSKVCTVLAASSPFVGLMVDSDISLTVRGLGLGGFTTAIELDAGSNHLVEGNVFSGFYPSATGISVGDAASNSYIGRGNLASRNLFQGSNIAIISYHQNFVVNNLIGLANTGISADIYSANDLGVFLVGDQNYLLNNVIAASHYQGVEVQGSNNVIAGNYVGTADCDGLCSAMLGNGGSGIEVSSGTGNNVNANVIGNNGVGISVKSGSKANRLYGNRISRNSLLGIDLEGNGYGKVNHNNTDMKEPSGAANAGLNYPEVTSASSAPGAVKSGVVNGALRTANGQYTVFLYANDACSPQGYGEGDEFIGSSTLTVTGGALFPPTDGVGQFSANVISEAPLIPQYITALAVDGNGNTSEFSKCFPYDRVFANDFEVP